MPYAQLSSPEFRVAVGKIFERRRKNKKFTYQDLATRALVSQRCIYEYESGETTPSMVVLLRIMYYLDISAPELMVCLKHDRPVRKTDTAAKSLGGKRTMCLVHKVRRGKECTCGKHIGGRSRASFELLESDRMILHLQE